MNLRFAHDFPAEGSSFADIICSARTNVEERVELGMDIIRTCRNDGRVWVGLKGNIIIGNTVAGSATGIRDSETLARVSLGVVQHTQIKNGGLQPLPGEI